MHLLWSKVGERFLDCRLPSLHSFHHAVAYPPGLAIAWITCPGMGHCSLSDDRRTLIFISESLFFDLVPFLWPVCLETIANWKLIRLHPAVWLQRLSLCSLLHFLSAGLISSCHSSRCWRVQQSLIFNSWVSCKWFQTFNLNFLIHLKHSAVILQDGLPEFQSKYNCEKPGWSRKGCETNKERAASSQVFEVWPPRQHWGTDCSGELLPLHSLGQESQGHHSGLCTCCWTSLCQWMSTGAPLRKALFLAMIVHWKEWWSRLPPPYLYLLGLVWVGLVATTCLVSRILAAKQFEIKMSSFSVPATQKPTLESRWNWRPIFFIQQRWRDNFMNIKFASYPSEKSSWQIVVII
jgi:hypothetical protein